MSDSSNISTGRRKTSIARVIVNGGKGVITVNNQSFEKFFPLETMRNSICLPLKATETLGKYDVSKNDRGCGTSGQAGAAQLGIARSLVAINENFRNALRAAGLLTRDPRMVERKKYGQKKARKRFQFSKR
jgi:small subunit ribosomal protein S9